MGKDPACLSRLSDREWGHRAGRRRTAGGCAPECLPGCYHSDRQPVTTVYIYIVGASSDPDRVECAVPWKVDDAEIFFGPCKKKLRESLRPRFLGPKADRAKAREDVFLAGFNALPASGRVRKVVWAGRIREAMSFGRAWLELTDERYESLRSARATPLHLEPIQGDGRPTAYRHFGLEHAEGGKWVDDILTPEAKRLARISGETVQLARGMSWWEGFPRDVCFLLDNLFFASGSGLDVDDELVALLREAQPDRRGVSKLAVFSLSRSGVPDGRRGGHLELTGDLANRFVRWVRSRAPRRKPPLGGASGNGAGRRKSGKRGSC